MKTTVFSIAMLILVLAFSNNCQAQKGKSSNNSGIISEISRDSIVLSITKESKKKTRRFSLISYEINFDFKQKIDNENSSLKEFQEITQDYGTDFNWYCDMARNNKTWPHGYEKWGFIRLIQKLSNTSIKIYFIEDPHVIMDFEDEALYAHAALEKFVKKSETIMLNDDFTNDNYELYDFFSKDYKIINFTSDDDVRLITKK